MQAWQGICLDEQTRNQVLVDEANALIELELRSVQGIGAEKRPLQRRSASASVARFQSQCRHSRTNLSSTIDSAITHESRRHFRFRGVDPMRTLPVP